MLKDETIVLLMGYCDLSLSGSMAFESDRSRGWNSRSRVNLTPMTEITWDNQEGQIIDSNLSLRLYQHTRRFSPFIVRNQREQSETHRSKSFLSVPCCVGTFIARK